MTPITPERLTAAGWQPLDGCWRRSLGAVTVYLAPSGPRWYASYETPTLAPEETGWPAATMEQLAALVEAVAGEA